MSPADEQAEAFLERCLPGRKLRDAKDRVSINWIAANIRMGVASGATIPNLQF
jgi:hypothetical protein